MLKSASTSIGVPEVIREDDDMLTLISKNRSHDAIARSTVSSCTKKVLRSAGIDTERHKAHSARAASTSAAITLGIIINTLMQHASWKSGEMFTKHYNEPIDEPYTSVTRTIARRNPRK